MLNEPYLSPERESFDDCIETHLLMRFWERARATYFGRHGWARTLETMFNVPLTANGNARKNNGGRYENNT